MKTGPLSLDKITELKSFKERTEYARAHLQVIGKGTTRDVFLLDTHLQLVALKVAKNKEGVHQNRVEALSGWNGYGCTAWVFSHAENFSWITMELCSKASLEDLKKVCGAEDMLISNEDFINAAINHMVIRWGSLGENDPLDYLRHHLDKTEKTNPSPKFADFVKSLDTFIDEANPDIATILDLRNIKNWGVAERSSLKHLVIVDYGYDNKSWERAIPAELIPTK